MKINLEVLEWNLRQWFLNIYKVWGIYQGKYGCFEVFANNAQEAVEIAIKEGIKMPKCVA